MTSPYAEVIGNPITQSKSPTIHNFWLNKLGIDATYRTALVTPAELLAYFAERRADPSWRGCNVTMPLKEMVAPFVDAVDPFAARAGAINIVVRDGGGLRGANSDGVGFVEPLGQVRRGAAMLIGTGGAARAIALALAEAGFDVTVFGRSLARAEVIAALAGGKARLLADLDPGEAPALLVNATALGMTGQPPLTLSLADWPRSTAVYDIVTSPLDTVLLRQARAAGMQSFDGLHMLVGQAAAAFERFFGAPAPRQHDPELRALLTA